VAAPSANISGQISPTRAAHVMSGLNGRIGAVLDGGPCDVGLESTIIGSSGEAVVLLRPGGLPREVIEDAIGLVLQSPEDGHIQAPGQLTSHYAPNAGLRLNVDRVWSGLPPLRFRILGWDWRSMTG